MSDDSLDAVRYFSSQGEMYMGCDIHLYSESIKDGKWVADMADTFDAEDNDMQESYNGGRDYWLFGLLSEGVRVDFDCAFSPKGFPEDPSTQVDTIYKGWGVDAHSSSHLSLTELQEKSAELLISSDQEAKALLPLLNGLIDGLPVPEGSENPDERRIVFWFDN